jgi:tripartite ATP-independent transporter DctP family solute receptor
MLAWTRRAALKGAAGAALMASFGRARAEPLKLKLGNDLPATHSVNLRLQEAIAAIADETHGEVAISLFPNNQLGNDKDMMSQLRSGALELATMPNVLISTLTPAPALFGVGYAFADYGKVWEAVDGDLGAYVRAAIAKTGVVPFETVWDNGFRQITSSTHPIASPQDLANFKIRVPVVPLWVAMFTAFGASPVSIPLAEAYSSLQTKVADGQENPLALIDAAKFYEVQKYCSMTNHAWDGFWLLASGKTWGGYPKDVQDILAKHFNAAAKKQRFDLVEATAKTAKTLEGKGLVFNAPDVSTFRAALGKTDFYKKARAKFNEEAWSVLQKYAGDIG